MAPDVLWKLPQKSTHWLCPDQVKSFHILLFQPNAHSTVNTYIYRQLPPTCFGVCYTIFRETIAWLTRILYFYVSHIYLFWIKLYMFRTVFPSIIRSSRLYIQQQVSVWHISVVVCTKCRIHPVCLNLQCCYTLKNMYFILLYLKILKMLLKIRNCSTLVSVGSSYLVCMLWT
jgi:hypothetical protein